MTKQKMKPGVINVLIAYVLKVNNQKFTRSYVETVASQWNRLNIETVEDAMRVAEKEHKKLKRLLNKNKEETKKKTEIKQEILPSWFDKEYDSHELSQEEKEELDNLLKEFS